MTILTTILAYLMIYLPPLIAAYFVYRWQRKKQARTREKNSVLLYLLPFIAFTVVTLIWSGLLYWFSGGLPSQQ